MASTWKSLVKWDETYTTVATERQPSQAAAIEATKRFLRSIGVDENRPFETVEVETDPNERLSAAEFYRPGVYNGD